MLGPATEEKLIIQCGLRVFQTSSHARLRAHSTVTKGSGQTDRSALPQNSLTPHVLTPARLTVLKLLLPQAAISLENTRLDRDLEKREAKIRRLVDANIFGVFIWEFE